MKMLSRRDCTIYDTLLEIAIDELQYCYEKMKGKYGTSCAVMDIRCAIRDIARVLSHKEKYQFRNPPNTPKSRRLGWHEGHIV